MRRFLLSVAAALLAASPLCAAPAVETFTLANGLEVIVIPNHRIPAVSQMVWYRVGAADDPPGKSGLAHYHEHAMFLGTARRKGGEYSAVVAGEGGDSNAFTAHDATGYFINIAREKLPLAMELEADRMRGLAPAAAAMEREKQVILEERRMRIENNPQALLREQVEAALFRNHPYRRPVIGWMQEMEGLTAADALAFHKAWYHPANAIVIISGDITAGEVRPLAEKYYGVLPKTPPTPRRWTGEPPQNGERRLVMRHANVTKPAWSRSYAVSSAAYGRKEQALPLFVLATALGEGKTSRLYRSLVVERKLASAVEVDYNGFTLGPATLAIYLTPENGADPEALEKALDEELARFLADPPGEAELDRARTLLKAESVYARDSLTSVARIMGWLRICGLGADYFARWPQLIGAVTADEVRRAAADALRREQSVTALLLPPLESE